MKLKAPTTSSALRVLYIITNAMSILVSELIGYVSILCAAQKYIDTRRMVCLYYYRCCALQKNLIMFKSGIRTQAQSPQYLMENLL